MNIRESSNSAPQQPFSERIRLLIQRVGSATEIARMCGFSEGVVRSWRDGSTDPSRARCVTLARTLGISLVWLVAGEGTIQIDTDMAANAGDDQYSGELVSSRHRVKPGTSTIQATAESPVDTQRLNTAMKILQSELELADRPLSLTEHGDMLAALYDILGPGGTKVDPVAMVMFNHRLAKRLKNERAAV